MMLVFRVKVPVSSASEGTVHVYRIRRRYFFLFEWWTLSSICTDSKIRSLRRLPQRISAEVAAAQMSLERKSVTPRRQSRTSSEQHFQVYRAEIVIDNDENIKKQLREAEFEILAKCDYAHAWFLFFEPSIIMFLFFLLRVEKSVSEKQVLRRLGRRTDVSVQSEEEEEDSLSVLEKHDCDLKNYRYGILLQFIERRWWRDGATNSSQMGIAATIAFSRLPPQRRAIHVRRS